MKGWHRAFDDPIPLSDGRTLITLRDAATFIMNLPKREHDEPEWQAAIEALMLVFDLGARRCSRASALCVRSTGVSNRSLSRDGNTRRRTGSSVKARCPEEEQRNWHPSCWGFL